MANAKKKRERKFPQAEFEIDMIDAVQALMKPGDVEPGDLWHFQADGAVLKITRLRVTEEIPVDPEALAPLARAKAPK